jgi:hypothetical protein
VKIFIFYLLAVFFIFEPQAVARDRLTIKEFLNLAEVNDPNFKKIIKDRDKLTFLIDQGLPSRQITLSVENEYGLGTNGEGHTSILEGTVSKEIIESGTTLSVSHVKTSRPDRDEDVTEIRLEQDLYKNLLGRDIRLKKQALKEEEQIVRLQVLEAYEDYLIKILGEYLDFKKAYLDKELAKVAYNDSVRLRNNVSEKKTKKIASQTDLDRSDLQVLLRKEDLINKRKILQSRWEGVQAIVGTAQDMMPSGDSLFLRGDFIDKSLKNDQGKTNHLRLSKIVDFQLSIASKEVKLSKRASNPSLKLIGGYNVDQSERFSSTVNRNEAVVGFKLELPLWDTQSSASKKGAIYAEQKADLEKEIVENRLTKEIKDTKNQLNEMKNKISVSKQKVEVTKRIMKAEEKRYQHGNIDLDDLIEMKSDFYEYRYQYQTDILEYNKVLLGWLSLNDRLLDIKGEL